MIGVFCEWMARLQIHKAESLSSTAEDSLLPSKQLGDLYVRAAERWRRVRFWLFLSSPKTRRIKRRMKESRMKKIQRKVKQIEPDG